MSTKEIYQPIKCSRSHAGDSAYEKSLEQIYSPISKELSDVEIELKNVVRGFSLANSEPKGSHYKIDSINEIIGYFFSVPGKRLRPALVLLSAKAVNCGLSTVDCGLIHLAVAVELIHSASLIHDDIIDNESHRRGQLSLNKRFGNKIAVLVGDMLYTHAFSILTDRFDNKILKILSQCVEKMCRGEINELRTVECELSHYLKILADKTASFMSACCQCGAILAGAAEDVSQMLADYGFNLGMAYQIVDDYIDGDIPKNVVRGFNLANEFASKAKRSIKKLKNSVYKEKLFDLVDYINRKLL